MVNMHVSFVTHRFHSSFSFFQDFFFACVFHHILFSCIYTLHILLDLSDIHHPLSLIVKKKKKTYIYGLDGLNIFVNFHVRKLFVLCFIINLSQFHYRGRVQYCDWGRYICIPTFPGYMNMSVQKCHIP